jgi:hypothetical protein
MESQRHAQFKPPCPFCAGSYGAPNMVTMRSQHRTITYVCGGCKNTWTQTDHAPPVLAMGEEHADGEHHKLIVEFAIPGAPTETIDVRIRSRLRGLVSPF